MSVQNTSVKTYNEIINEGLLGRMEEMVFDYIEEHPFVCDRQIAAQLKLKINQVTGRRNDLVNQGCVVEAGEEVDPVTHRTVLTWKVPEKIKFKPKQKVITKQKCEFCNGRGYFEVQG